jgi:predicted glycogen debranching enzyme
VIIFERDTLQDFESSARREWLVANGIGGFACGTIAGINTRRYHGLLVASLNPPVQRTLLLAKLDVTATYRGRSYSLATNQFADGTISPRGFVHLDSFALDGQLPVWTWLIGDALLEQRVWMAHGQNTTYIGFRLIRGSESVQLDVAPLCAYRDFHSHHRGYRDTLVTAADGGIRVDAFFGAVPHRLLADRGAWQIAPQWYWNFKHPVESARGLDDLEDLVCPARLRVTLDPGIATTIIATCETTEPLPASVSLKAEQARQSDLVSTARSRGLLGAAADDATVRQLVIAADQFIVGRQAGTTVIAGYPWFSDWGRDTMIALPGLTLATGRPEIAATIIRTFAQFVSDGMLPNLFPDAGHPPEYNTVDATLWYFVAIDEYLRATNDRALLEDLYPTLRSIVRWHQRGTRYSIQVDEADGLLRAGEPGVQLTWMDAKIGDWVVTPRTGKPVEINALWFNVLMIMRDFATQLGDPQAAAEYETAARRCARSFRERFWFAQGGHLYDVVDGPQGNDESLRPNQIFAVSLRHALLEGERARSVVDVCAKHLWTPVGLRSLAPQLVRGGNAVPQTTEPRYAGAYVGGPRERDAIYHQGTVWSWLLGPFVCAHYRVYGDLAQARTYLDGIRSHLRDACVGQISEIFDGDPPFTAAGCFAQAWGVAEILRAWGELHEREIEQPISRKAGRSRTAVRKQRANG